MQISKKLLFSAAALLPLAIAPVAIVASCATTVGPAQAYAEALHQGNNISFQNNKGTYTQAQLDAFRTNPSSFKNELSFNVPDVDNSKFSVDITRFDSNKNESNLSQSTITIDYKVTNSEQVDGKDDVGEYKGHQLTFTFSDSTGAPTQSAKDLADQANKAFIDNTLKLKDGLALNGADYALINGISSLADDKVAAINSNLLDRLFDGIVKGNDQIPLSVAKFKVAPKTTKAEQNITITLQLKYGSDKDSVTTNAFTFNTKYSDAISAANVLNSLDVFMEGGWIEYVKPTFANGEVDAIKFFEDTVTNFKQLETKFLPTGFTFALEDWNDQPDKNDQKLHNTSFKFKVTKGSDSATSTKDYTLQYQLA